MRKDPITELAVHSDFQIDLAKREGPLAILLVDIDYFRKVNDHYGHEQGDDLLKQVGAIVVEAVRPDDLVCRFGADCFSVTMPNTDRRSSLVVAERIRRNVESREFVTDKGILRLTISGGVAAKPENAENRKQLVRLAEQKLKECKDAGRNRTG